MAKQYYLADYSTAQQIWRIPAAGLYLYVPTQDNKLQEWVIGAKGEGKPSTNPVTMIECPRIAAHPLDNPNEVFIAPAHWLEVPGEQSTYLAFNRRLPSVDPQQAQIVWQNALEPLPGVPDALIFRQGISRTLTTLANTRRKEAYMTAKENGTANPQLQTLAANAEIFWNALLNVSEALIQHMETSFRGAPSPIRKFSYPEWVFQLNRTLAEGFLEGHVSSGLTLPVGYEVEPMSTASWEAAIQRAKDNWSIDTFRNAPAGTVTDDEKRAMSQLAQALMRFVPDVALDLLNRNEDDFLDYILDAFTPGTEPSQTFTFWHLHYAHWYKDLSFALSRYGYPAKLQNTEEWATIAQLIMKSFPDEGRGISLGDWLLAKGLHLLGDSGVAFPKFLTFLVESVLLDIEATAASAR